MVHSDGDMTKSNLCFLKKSMLESETESGLFDAEIKIHFFFFFFFHFWSKVGIWNIYLYIKIHFLIIYIIYKP